MDQGRNCPAIHQGECISRLGQWAIPRSCQRSLLIQSNSIAGPTNTVPHGHNTYFCHNAETEDRDIPSKIAVDADRCQGRPDQNPVGWSD